MGHPSPYRRHRLPIDPRRDPYFCEWGEVVGGRIRRLRKARGMTLQALSDSLVLPGDVRPSVGYLSRLERGWSSPPFFTYVAIVEALGGDVWRVFGPDLVDADPAEAMLLQCLRELGVEPQAVIVRLLRDRDADQQLTAVDHHRIAAVE
jgi:transcriptional regulator with XRE-family HTH domain